MDAGRLIEGECAGDRLAEQFEVLAFVGPGPSVGHNQRAAGETDVAVMRSLVVSVGGFRSIVMLPLLVSAPTLMSVPTPPVPTRTDGGTRRHREESPMFVRGRSKTATVLPVQAHRDGAADVRRAGLAEESDGRGVRQFRSASNGGTPLLMVVLPL